MISINELVSRVESNEDIHAIRFEPSIYMSLSYNSLPRAVSDCLNEISKANDCSMYTAKMIYSTSWGEYQLLGETLYSNPLCYNGKIVDFLIRPEIQGIYFNHLIVRKCVIVPDLNPPVGKELTIEDFQKFAIMYNGPGDPVGYATRMLEVWNELREGEING